MARTTTGTASKSSGGRATRSRSSTSKSNGSSRASSAKTSSRSNGSSRASSAKTSSRSNGSSRASSKSSPRSSSKASSNGRSTSSRGKSQTQRRSTTKSSQAKSTQGGDGGIKDTAKDAANGIGEAVSKAKVPIVAAGAALAGLGGAAVIAATRPKKRKVLGVSIPKRSGISLPKPNGFKADAGKVAEAVADAAKRADLFGKRVSQVASSVQSVSETANEAVKKT
jgi:hypothetical protein